MYTAHRVASGMTSIYRQIGIGCQRLVQQILMDQLGLTAQESTWSYQIKPRGGKSRILALDARIELAAILNAKRRAKAARWLQAASRELAIVPALTRVLRGGVFEVRQGYKSKDSKRQQADLSNASAAYAATYLPVLMLLSSQIDEDVAERYQNARWLILRGTTTGLATNSTYVFCRDVLDYDLAAFFERNSTPLKHEIANVLKALLK